MVVSHDRHFLDRIVSQLFVFKPEGKIKEFPGNYSDYLIKEKEENLSGEDCQEGMYLVFNITAPGVSYDAQTKSRIVKLDMAPFTTVISDEIRNWLIQNEKDINAYCSGCGPCVMRDGLLPFRHNDFINAQGESGSRCLYN